MFILEKQYSTWYLIETSLIQTLIYLQKVNFKRIKIPGQQLINGERKKKIALIKVYEDWNFYF